MRQLIINAPIGGYCQPRSTTDTQFTGKGVKLGDVVIAECKGLEPGLSIGQCYVIADNVLFVRFANCTDRLIQPAIHKWRFVILNR